jgi:multiple sugar transport system permease protein
MASAIRDLDEGYARLPAFASTRWPDVAVIINERFGDLLYNPERQGITPASVCSEVTEQGNRVLQEAADELKGTSVPWNIVLFVIALLILAGLIAMIRASRKKAGKSKLAKFENTWGYAMISPWLVGFIIFTAGPILFSIFLSFCRWLALGPPETARFVGLDNFEMMFTADPKFSKSLLVTSYYTLLYVPLGLVAGIALALLMNTKLRGIRVFRTIYFLPAVLPSVAVTVLWSNMFKKNGLLNYILLKAYNLTIGLVAGPMTYSSMPDWLVDANSTIPALVIIALWGIGGGMMIYLAGLQGISPDLYEAAELDGAGRWKQFWRITLPQLSPVIFFNLIMSIIGSFQVFTQAYILFGIEGGLNMQAGGPEDSALFYVLRLYLKAFKEFQMGYASGLAWVLFIIILIFTLIVFKSSPLWVYYEGQKEGKAV